MCDIPNASVETINPSDRPMLSVAQSLIVDMAKRGDSFFFSGCAGTGKTYTLRSIIECLPINSTFVTAMTGIASSLLPQGTTLHSFAGIGHGSGPKDLILKKVKSNQKAVGQWKKCKTLIIDEVSMLSKELFELIDYIGREVRGKYGIPFGGIQVICCGDFFQLPPVAKNAEASYCFESPLWVEVMGGYSFELLDIFRQKDQRLINILNEIRHGEITHVTNEMVNQLRRDIILPTGIIPTMLVPVNATADAINMQELQKLPFENSELFQAHDWAVDAYTLDMLPKITLFPDKLPLRLGAQVMLLKNNAPLKLWNGSRGIVVGFRDQAVLDRTADMIVEGSAKDSARFGKLPVVRFASGQEVVVGGDAFELEAHSGKDRVRARRVQIPLRLSWAITIHKSQGMSLDYLKVDCSRSFEAGQAYVALSRARSIEGLQILSFDARKCWCDPKVVEFYKSGITRLTQEECEKLGKSTKRPKSKMAQWEPPMENWRPRMQLREKKEAERANPIMDRIISSLTRPPNEQVLAPINKGPPSAFAKNKASTPTLVKAESLLCQSPQIKTVISPIDLTSPWSAATSPIPKKHKEDP
jgi:ATP-dependent DNA helicase PIF1